MKKKREFKKCKFFTETDWFPEVGCTQEEITRGCPYECRTQPTVQML